MVFQLLKVFVKPTNLWKDNQLNLNNKEVSVSLFYKMFANLTVIFKVIGFTIVIQFVHPLNALYFTLKWDVIKSSVRTYGILFRLSLAVVPNLFLIQEKISHKDWYSNNQNCPSSYQYMSSEILSIYQIYLDKIKKQVRECYKRNKKNVLKQQKTSKKK